MIDSQFTHAPLDELERRARGLNDRADAGPVVYLDDREDVIEQGGHSAWFEILAMRLEVAQFCAADRASIRATRARSTRAA